MKDTLVDFVKNNLGPFLFLALAGSMCILLPQDKIADALYLVIGAALTRVKRTK